MKIRPALLWLVPLLVLPFAAMLAGAGTLQKATEPKGKQIVFSYTEYPDVRNAYIDMTHGISTAVALGQIKREEIGVYHAPLSDVSSFMAVYVKSPYTCAARGCLFQMFEYEEGVLMHLSSELVLKDNLVLADTKQYSFQDILYDSGDGKIITWRMDGNTNLYGPLAADGKTFDNRLPYERSFVSCVGEPPAAASAISDKLKD
jgi:hypothetical protein